jgi:hypothetical protein
MGEPMATLLSGLPQNVIQNHLGLKKRKKKSPAFKDSISLLFLSLNIKRHILLMIKAIVIDLGGSVNIYSVFTSAKRANATGEALVTI